MPLARCVVRSWRATASPNCLAKGSSLRAITVMDRSGETRLAAASMPMKPEPTITIRRAPSSLDLRVRASSWLRSETTFSASAPTKSSGTASLPGAAKHWS